MEIARDQSAGGAHALDLCVALTESENETGRMENLVRAVTQTSHLPLVIDSTSPNVMERALQAAPGKCLLNSINLENGEGKARAVLHLAREHNAAVIALTIDESGMAHTADRKLSVARSIFSLAVEECGLAPSDLIFDPLTFTLASGSVESADSAVHTLEAIQRIKTKIPDSFTLLGVSNVSFGLKGESRKVLTSVFLHHAVQAGLDIAILNPAQILPFTHINEEVKQLAENLIFNRRQDALGTYLSCFENKDGPEKLAVGISADALPIEERIANHILQRQPRGLEADLDAFIHTSGSPAKNALVALNTVLLPAMKTIGEQFGSGELILPFVLQSAEIMRAATDHLDQYLEKSGENTRGTIILATVYGDVHDIGKNLVKTILANNGWDVLDLGKQVPAETIVREAVESGADAVGLSALLVSTSQQMTLVVELLHTRGLTIPVLIGGAAVNQAFAQRVAQIDDKTSYNGGVYYCADAFGALAQLDTYKRKKDA